MKKIYIVGAHSRAQTVAAYLQYLCEDTIVEAYLYDNDEKNPEKVDGIPVIYLNTEVLLHTDYPVYIGTKGIYHKKIIEGLKKYGFKDIYPVTVEMDLKLRNVYLKKYFLSINRKFLKLEMLKSGRIDENKESSKVVYVVKSIYDKALQHKYTRVSYERDIQVGAALTKIRLHQGILTDDIGDNISSQNKQYCELTALYWLWKHAEDDIIGLVHYRRHFILPKDWELRMRKNQIDVILPVPLYVAPNLAENFKNRHGFVEWDYMMECLKKRDICEYKEAETYFQGNLYSPCNMFIMRKKVLDELCAWLFPILFCVVNYVGQKMDDYQNRYPGFLSERLISFFFEKNRGKFKVVYADKNFLE